MAPSQKQIRVIAQKLETLKTDKKSLFKSFDSYFNKVISLGESWIERCDISGASFSDIRAAFDKAISYIFDVTEEINGLPAAQQTTSAVQCTFLDSHTASSSVAASLDKNIHSLEKRMNALENEGDIFNHKYQDTVVEVTLTLSEMKDRIMALEREKEAAEDKIKRLEENIQQNDNVNVYTKSLERKLESCETELIRMKNLEDRLQQTEVQRNKDLDIMEEIKLQVASVTSKMNTQQRKRHPLYGFKACVDEVLTYKVQDLIKFNYVVASNPANAYNATTGIFTAPVNGMFEVKLTHQYPSHYLKDHHLKYPGDILQVVYEPARASYTDNKGWEIGGVMTTPTVISDIMERRILMCVGDRLYVRVGMVNGYGNPLFSSFSTFSCFLIN